ncbi:type III secretion system HrpP C-terminal domain-containing protein [Pseudomonas sp. 15FMM2]|uniref:Type III secretion system HrpP C-terminal domain-containing protein n=1 Tax=Pseudomonas imrae TaxID=2992837 RepID=A0ACC7P995_9PSED
MRQLSLDKTERKPVREPDAGAGAGNVVSLEQSQLFAQYLGDESGGEGFSSRMPEQVSPLGDQTIDALAEQLEMRLSGVSQWPLNMTLYMPRLGRINVRAGHENQSWDITLEAEEARTSIWLAGVRQGCQERLCRGLGQPVSLRVLEVEET